MSSNVQNNIGLISLFTSSAEFLGKRYSLDIKDQIQKEISASIESGTVCVKSISLLSDLFVLLLNLKPNQALGYGIPVSFEAGDTIEITTQKKLPTKIASISRDGEHFHFFNGPGILMLDCDSSIDVTLTPEETRDLIIQAVPELSNAPMLWCPSSSSFIGNSETCEMYSLLRGQRFYILLADAREIPRVGDIIFSRLVLNGHGFVVVSKSGQLLLRTLIDKAVFQPERLDFGSKAHCVEPITQNIPTCLYWNEQSKPLDTSLIASLNEIEKLRYQGITAKLKSDIKPQQEKIRSIYIDERAKDLVQQQGITISEAVESIKQALDGCSLNSDFTLTPHGGFPVTVAEILKDPSKWHGVRFSDPLEPEYKDDPRVAWLCCNTSGPPRLYSHAHGLHFYLLIGEKPTITVQSGNVSKVVDKTLKVMRSSGQIFDYGNNSMARVSDELIYPITKNDSPYLKDFVERNAYYERHGEKGVMFPCSVPADVIQRILAKNGERKLPKLQGLISAPTLKVDGSLIQDPGYDESSGLYLQIQQDEFPRIPDLITDEDILHSTKVLLEPFERFAFEDATSRSVLLAGLLTAAVRSSVSTRPAFAFDAPAAGSGKTLLGSCISALAGGTGATQPAVEDDDELRKIFVTLLRQGASDIFLDNVIGILDGAAINHLLTASIYQGRILGQSETISVPNNAILLLTGNNLRIHKDLMRRVLICRLDTGMEKPYTKHFSFCPLGMIKSSRMKYIRHALIILRGCMGIERPDPEFNLGSFEEWDFLVRRSILTICELVKHNPDYGHIELADPIQNMLNSVGHDPETATIDLLLRGLRSMNKEVAVSPRDIYSIHTGIRYVNDAGNSEQGLLREALAYINDDLGGKLSARRLGSWLLNRKDRVIGGLKLVGIKDNQSQGYIWRALPVENAGSTGRAGTF
jgi:hypothetical protein